MADLSPPVSPESTTNSSPMDVKVSRVVTQLQKTLCVYTYTIVQIMFVGIRKARPANVYSGGIAFKSLQHNKRRWTVETLSLIHI